MDVSNISAIPVWLRGNDVLDIRKKLVHEQPIGRQNTLELSRRMFQSRTGLPMFLVDLLVYCPPFANYAMNKTTTYLTNHPTLVQHLTKMMSLPGLDMVEPKLIPMKTTQYYRQWQTISLCMEAIRAGGQKGVLPQGLFRLEAEDKAFVNDVAAKFEREESILKNVRTMFSYHDIAVSLKKVLRSTFPADSSTDSFFEGLANIGNEQQSDQTFDSLQEQVKTLSPDRQALLREVIRFARDLISYQSQTNLDAGSIVSLLQPGIIGHTDLMVEARGVKNVQKAVEIMIEHSEQLWPTTSGTGPGTSGSQ